ncbi:DUF3343 domain-containing protein [Acidaminobacter sp. JC074]|uniref:DUF3343 domain-containing protein n=1 Tax=Acidaminobacter sp. JC074 TaxID=2530199 RepID=UPI001F0F6CCD|nr:DUF3343 domain-containing protein [Acidaminobacter sp. JC074]MCH4887351.1 DUF3343 domain-containing protein [Acidaminobacter sp. JC074]
MSYLVITFESTHKAIKAEKQLASLDVEIIPTPRQLSANCGISIKARVEDLEQIKEKMEGSYGDMNQAYEVHQEDGALTFKKL